MNTEEQSNRYFYLVTFVIGDVEKTFLIQKANFERFKLDPPPNGYQVLWKGTLNGVWDSTHKINELISDE